MAKKGPLIRIIGGDHAGKNPAWLNAGKPDHPASSFNIIVMGVDGTLLEKQARKHNIQLVPKNKKKPTSYAEAVLEQNPDINVMMMKLCKELAMCRIEKDYDKMAAIFKDTMHAAVTNHKMRTGKAKMYRDEVSFEKQKQKRG